MHVNYYEGFRKGALLYYHYFGRSKFQIFMSNMYICETFHHFCLFHATKTLFNTFTTGQHKCTSKVFVPLFAAHKIYVSTKSRLLGHWLSCFSPGKGLKIWS